MRPYIVRDPDLVFARLHAWSRDPDWRVRRLASEGSRPRLPWGLRLRRLVDDPTPLLPLLESMRDDPHDNVRNSVASHRSVRVVVDYAVHHRRANGGTTPRVFKLTARSLAPGETIQILESHVFRPVTTRRYYPGERLVELLVNGASAGRAAFTLTS